MKETRENLRTMRVFGDDPIADDTLRLAETIDADYVVVVAISRKHGRCCSIICPDPKSANARLLGMGCMIAQGSIAEGGPA